ncbi:hypothetical protein DPEC_G00342300 [Dallia pectoralis]|uniref:Uncharacterized protein n=1 Tax=Dallia pectoralis TaxID=75939 RepID=A0ACC2F5P8_DALPE|nr:hypothetical protein DPEC_G00342300 [Dallia pectoralis]
MADSILIAGDFNIHMENTNDPLQKAFSAIIDSVGFLQHVSGPTHCHNHTLDLVLSKGINVIDLTIFPQNPGLSDHNLITFSNKTSDTFAPQVGIFKTCCINSTTNKFIDALPGSFGLLNDGRATSSIHNQIEDLNDILRKTLDAVAPLKTKPIRNKKLAPWYTDTTRTLKQASRKLERKSRSTKLEVFRLAWIDSTVLYRKSLISARSAYLSNLIDTNKNNPKFLFDTIAKLTKKQCLTNEVGLHFSCDEFMNYFDEKIINIRKEIANCTLNCLSSQKLCCTESPQSCPDLVSMATLESFLPVSLETFTKLINSSKSTNCQLDPIPTKLLKELLPVIGPSMLNIINCSLSSGSVPTSLKIAEIKPLLKKCNLDPDILKNYRPISNLPFLSKILEKSVSLQRF